jgi:HK97 family phage major capsid protein
MRTIKHVRQDIAVNDAAIAKLKVEGRTLLGAATRTDEQNARLKAVEAEVDALTAKGSDLASELVLFEKMQAEERAQGSYVEGSHIQGGHDHAVDRPFASMGEQLVAIARAQSPQGTFQGAGIVDPRLFAGPTGASAGEPSTGGFFLRTGYSDQLLARAREESPILGMCNTIPIPEGTESIDLPVIEETSRATGSRWGGVRVYRKAEADTVTASKPKFGLLKIDTSEMMGIAYATERLLRNARTIEAVFGNAFASEFAFKATDEIIRGGGGAEFLGLLNAPATVSQAKETSQTAATVNFTNLIKMWARVHPKSQDRGVWLINTDVEPQLDVLAMQYTAGTDGIAVLPPRFITYDDKGVMRIKGRPVLKLEQCATLGTVGDIIFADFNEYIVSPQGTVTGDSSMHVRFLYNEMTFRWNYYINGRPGWVSALTPFKGTATLSPFVTLATRA